MRIPIILTALSAITVSPAAHADFVITSTPPAADSLPVSEAPPKVSVPANHSVPPRFKTAYGFGNQVPLSFAVRQIVPSTIYVTYGRGADRSSLVDWKGGQSWNRALLDAVKPLGLRLVIGDRAVEIRK
jgi:hypothetical protein